MHKLKLKTILVATLFLLCIFPLFSETAKGAGDLTIYYPSGGETLYQNEMYNIYWTSEDIGSYVKIELCKSGYTYYTLTSSTANDGSYQWQVPESVSGSIFYIKITDTQHPYIYNTSETFNINYQHITITSPSSANTWYKGESYSITWIADIYSSDVDIYYETDSSSIQIASGTTNDGRYTWTLPEYPVSGSSYRIKISSTFGSYVYDYSPYFQITERQIVVYSPNSGDILRTGKTYIITWGGGVSGVPVDIFLEQNGISWLIDQTVENDGSYSWTVSESYYTGSNYMILIYSGSDSSNQCYSDTFTIRREFISVSSPYINEKLYKGKTRTISWSSENAGNYFDISLYKNEEHVLTIDSNAYNYGYYQWIIPDDIETSYYYQIKITSLSTTDLYDFSDYFTIDEQYIRIISPTENDIYYKGNTYHITWESKNIGDNVTIDLYSYFQSSYDLNYKSIKYQSSYDSYHTSIAYQTYNDGDFSWKIPNDLSTENIYKIKIIAYADYLTYNFSGNFSINESITITSLANFETWTKEKSHYINWESSEIVGEYVKIELLENNEPYFIIAENTNNDGSFLWEIPDSIEQSLTYAIKISSSSNSDIYAISKGYLQIEDISLGYVLGTVFILIIAVIAVIVVLVVVRKILKKRIKNKVADDISKIEEQVDQFLAPQEIKTYDISDEEYERIWERPQK